MTALLQTNNCRYLNFLKSQCRTGRKKPPCQKPSSLLTEHRLVTDTDGRTDRHRATASSHSSMVLCWCSLARSTGQADSSAGLHSPPRRRRRRGRPGGGGGTRATATMPGGGRTGRAGRYDQRPSFCDHNQTHTHTHTHTRRTHRLHFPSPDSTRVPRQQQTNKQTTGAVLMYCRIADRRRLRSTSARHVVVAN